MSMHPTKHRVLTGIWDKSLKPRFHNGVGFAQLYITPDVRLHIWHPALPAEPEGFGCRHDHRFDFVSTVLQGAVTNIHLDYMVGPLGTFARYRVQPAHLGPSVPEIVPGEEKVTVLITGVEVVREGETYSFPKRVFHESRGHGVTVTAMRKFNQEDSWAGILAPIGQTPEHGMERCSINAIDLSALVVGVLDALSDSAWDQVQRMLDDDLR